MKAGPVLPSSWFNAIKTGLSVTESAVRGDAGLPPLTTATFGPPDGYAREVERQQQEAYEAASTQAQLENRIPLQLPTGLPPLAIPLAAGGAVVLGLLYFYLRRRK